MKTWCLLGYGGWVIGTSVFVGYHTRDHCGSSIYEAPGCNDRLQAMPAQEHYWRIGVIRAIKGLHLKDRALQKGLKNYQSPN